MEHLRRSKEERLADKAAPDAEIAQLQRGIRVDMEALIRCLAFKPVV